MSTSNESDAKSLSKLALLLSGAATAAFLISQTRLLQRLSVPAQLTPVLTPAGPDEPVDEEPPRESVTDIAADPADEPSGSDDGRDADDDHGGSRPGSSNGRRRVIATRPARDRLHYGLPVRHRRGRRNAPISTEPGLDQAPVAVMAPSSLPVFDGEDFAPEYLAIVEAIARDGRLDYEEGGAEPEAAPTTRQREAVEATWWLPAPRLRYILAALIYVAVAAAAGSDPVTLAAEAIRALAAVNTTADLVLLGWVVCGLIVVVPLGTIAARSFSVATRDKIRRPGFISHETADSAGWGLRLLATSAFIAGAVLYTPYALSWALDTDYPVAAVSSSSMSPALHEGELVFIRGIDSPSELNIGDIIAFEHDSGIAVRRVSGFVNDAIITSADSRPNENLLVALDDVAGRILRFAGSEFKLPFLGNISLLGERTVEPRASLTGP